MQYTKAAEERKELKECEELVERIKELPEKERNTVYGFATALAMMQEQKNKPA